MYKLAFMGCPCLAEGLLLPIETQKSTTSVLVLTEPQPPQESKTFLSNRNTFDHDYLQQHLGLNHDVNMRNSAEMSLTALCRSTHPSLWAWSL